MQVQKSLDGYGKRKLQIVLPKRAWLLVQILVTVGLLIWIFHSNSLRGHLIPVLEKADTRWIVLGLLVAGLENFFGMVRWSIFLKVMDIRIGFARTMQIYLIGLLFNTFLIGQIGGDAVKVLILIGQGQRKTKAILSVILDRISGLSSMIIVSAVFVGLQYNWLIQSGLVSGLIHFLILYLITAVGVLSFSFVMARLGHAEYAPQWLPGRKVIIQMCESYFSFVRKWRFSVLACLVSLLMLLGYFFVYYCSARAFSCSITVIQLYALMPVVDIITALPISLGGVGVREQLFITLLGQLLGTPAATAVLISMGGFLMTTFWGVIGVFTLPFYRGWIVKGREVQKYDN